MARYDTRGNSLPDVVCGVPPAVVPKDYEIDGTGNIHIAGECATDVGIFKCDPDGHLLWEWIHNGPGNAGDAAYALHLDTEGNVYATGTVVGETTGNDYITVKLDANGNELWARRWSSPGASSDVAYELAIDPTGCVVVAGYPSIVKYSAEGTELWVRQMVHHNGHIAVDSSGNVYFAGELDVPNTWNDVITIKFGPDGAVLWEQQYNSARDNHDYPRGMALDEEGNIYVVGVTVRLYAGDWGDFLTLKYAGNGELLWDRLYNWMWNVDEPNAFYIDRAGNIYLTGEGNSHRLGKPFLTIRYDREGNLIWDEQYTRYGIADEANAIYVDDHQNVYVAGYSIAARWPEETATDWTTIKYVQEWEVNVDIQPGRCPSYLSPYVAQPFIQPASVPDPAPATVEVAILGTADFDVSRVNRGTIVLNGVSALSHRYEDVATPAVRESDCDCTAAGGDGLTDLVFEFEVEALLGTLDLTSTGNPAELHLHGRTWTQTPLRGEDCAKVVRTRTAEATRIPQQLPDFTTLGNYPNPFNATTVISYSLPQPGQTTLDIYDMLGRRVVRLVDGFQTAGPHQIAWDGTDDDGTRVASGIYPYRLSANGGIQTRSAVIVK